MLFVLFHGSYGTTEENWLPWLKENLQKLGQDVLLEQYPIESYKEVMQKGKGYKSTIQNIENWEKHFVKIYKEKIKQHKQIIFVGHSIAPVFILHLIQKYNIMLSGAVFVSPFFVLKDLWQFDAVNSSFYKEEFDFTTLTKLIPKSYVLYGTNDPYVPQDQPTLFAQKLHSTLIAIPNGGHLNSEAGFTQFPQLLEICKAFI